MATSTGVLGLKPPENMNRCTAEEFKKFKQRFEIYRVASGAGSMSQEVQVALLLHTIGPQCLEIYNTFNLGEDEKNNYMKVMKRFEDHFIPLKNESVASHTFFSRNQKPNESFDEYLTDLKRLASDCDFGSLTERLIRDRIVTGIKDSKLKDRMLREQ